MSLLDRYSLVRDMQVREATSNDPWGPSSSLMSEIADLTFNVVAFAEVMGMVWKRLNDSGKNWRHVYKVRPHWSTRSTRPGNRMEVLDTSC